MRSGSSWPRLVTKCRDVRCVHPIFLPFALSVRKRSSVQFVRRSLVRVVGGGGTSYTITYTYIYINETRCLCLCTLPIQHMSCGVIISKKGDGSSSSRRRRNHLNNNNKAATTTTTTTILQNGPRPPPPAAVVFGSMPASSGKKVSSSSTTTLLFIPGLICWEHGDSATTALLDRGCCCCSTLGCAVMGSQLLIEPALPPNRRSRSSAIQISNIPEQYPWDEFSQLLSNFGSVQHCEKGCVKQNTYSAIATYENQEQAQQVQQQLNNYEIQVGALLKVDFWMDLARGRGGRGGRPGSRPFSNSGMPFRSNDFPLRILVLSDMVGAIIGRAGGTIRQITQQSRARVDVHRKENAGSPEKVITIYGTPESCSTACHRIMEIMQQEANTTNRGEIPLKILAHNNLIGRIIGKNGNTIKRIMEQTDTKIAVSSNIHDLSCYNLERIITVRGKAEGMSKAEKLISAKLRQSYENDIAAMSSQNYMYPSIHPMAMISSTPGMMPPPPPRGPPSPYGGMYSSPCMPMGFPQNSFAQEFPKETVIVYIPNSSVGAIIGTGGSTIKDMISVSGASIKVAQPKSDPNVDKSPERKVSIIGTPESQWKAQYMLFKKVGFENYAGPQDATLKVEILVPVNQVGRIIGKGGQTVRELQRVTHAVIKFPEEAEKKDADAETAVHIIGDFFCTQAAQRQIRAIVYKSQTFQRRKLSQQSLPNIQN